MTPFAGVNRVTSPYGYREYWYRGALVKEHHRGQDIVGDTDRRVRAIWPAQRCEASLGWNGGRGNMVTLYYSGTLRVICQHLESIAVRQGAAVEQGEVIGVMGSSGQSTGAHLHIEVQRKQGGVWAAVAPSAYTEVPNRAGRHPGNNTLDGAVVAPAPPELWRLTVGPMTAGDRDGLRGMADSLLLPVALQTAKAAAPYTLVLGPMSAGDRAVVEAEVRRLRLPLTAQKAG